MAEAHSRVDGGPKANPKRHFFTLDEARRALPLVRRIAGDVQAVQQQRMALHARLSAETIPLPSDELARVQKELDGATARLEELADELFKIGVELKDPARVLLDFPAIHQGREISLCWMSGEATITHWHEVDGGFAGRRPVELLK